MTSQTRQSFPKFRGSQTLVGISIFDRLVKWLSPTPRISASVSQESDLNICISNKFQSDVGPTL